MGTLAMTASSFWHWCSNNAWKALPTTQAFGTHLISVPLGTRKLHSCKATEVETVGRGFPLTGPQKPLKRRHLDSALFSRWKLVRGDKVYVREGGDRGKVGEIMR